MATLLSTAELIVELKRRKVRVSERLLRDWTARGLISPSGERRRGVPARWSADVVPIVERLKSARAASPRRKSLKTSLAETWLAEGSLPANMLTSSDFIRKWFDDKFAGESSTIVATLFEFLKAPSHLDDEVSGRVVTAQECVSGIVDGSQGALPAGVTAIAEIALRSAVTKGFSEGGSFPEGIEMTSIFPLFEPDGFRALIASLPLDVFANYSIYLDELKEYEIERSRILLRDFTIHCAAFGEAIFEVSDRTNRQPPRALQRLSRFLIEISSYIRNNSPLAVLALAIFSQRDLNGRENILAFSEVLKTQAAHFTLMSRKSEKSSKRRLPKRQAQIK